MIRGRFRKAAVAAGAGMLVAMTTLAIVPTVAGAAGSAPSGTTVTANHPTIATGLSVEFTATVSAVSPDASTRATRGLKAFRISKAATGNAPVPTGTVTFVFTGTAPSTITCTGGNAKNLSPSGTAKCTVPVEQFQAEASPYAVQANYGGDGNYATSSGDTSEVVTKATTKTHIKIKPKPRNETSNTVTAKVLGGKGGSLLAGDVVFSVSATPSTPASKRKCAGGDVQPITVHKNHATATCVLASGWFTTPKKTQADPHPRGTYDVTAQYSGNGNFDPSSHSKSGGAK
jgi:hypothetical protein